MSGGFLSFEGYLFDLDGCLYEGDRPVAGAVDLVAGLRARGKKVAFLSNNSTLGADQVAHKLRQMGIDAAEDEVLVPTDWAGEFLRSRFGLVSVYPIGSARIHRAIGSTGHRLVDDPEGPCDVVFVARDLDFTYQKVETAARYLQAGAALVTANPDLSHPEKGGLQVPETGALAASIASVTGARHQTLGKPGPYLFGKALDRLGLRPEQVVMVGDNLGTDMAGARAAGLSGVWINPTNLDCGPEATPWRVCRRLLELTEETQNAPQEGAP